MSPARFNKIFHTCRIKRMGNSTSVLLALTNLNIVERAIDVYQQSVLTAALKRACSDWVEGSICPAMLLKVGGWLVLGSVFTTLVLDKANTYSNRGSVTLTWVRRKWIRLTREEQIVQPCFGCIYYCLTSHVQYEERWRHIVDQKDPVRHLTYPIAVHQGGIDLD